MFNNLGVFFSFPSPKVRHEGMSCGYCDRRAMSNGPKVGQGEMRSTEERCVYLFLLLFLKDSCNMISCHVISCMNTSCVNRRIRCGYWKRKLLLVCVYSMIIAATVYDLNPCDLTCHAWACLYQRGHHGPWFNSTAPHDPRWKHSPFTSTQFFQYSISKREVDWWYLSYLQHGWSLERPLGSRNSVSFMVISS